MCGFAGVYIKNSASRDYRSRLLKVGDIIKHRGPDEVGFYDEGRIKFIFRRLSIIDLKGSSQPLRCADNRYIITFNGELYNYKDLRRQYLSGKKFRTDGDAEVALEMYKKFGTSCLNYFRGMFAFAIFDTHEEVLILFRDQIGIKPLYYYEDSEHLLFGSEIKALKALMATTPSLSATGIDDYLTYGHSSGEATIFQGVKKVRPGETVRISRSESIVKELFPVLTDDSGTSKFNNPLSVRNALVDSVTSQLVSDVPIGAFLSGGVDSSLLVSLMSERVPNLQTFSIYFEGQNETERYNAEMISKQFGTKHTSIKYQETDFTKLSDIVSLFDEPFADSSALPMYQLTKLVSNSLKVALSGDGVDELFGGYSRYERYASVLKHKKLHTFARILATGIGPFMNSHSDIYAKLNTLSQKRTSMPAFWGLFNERQRKLLYSSDFLHQLRDVYAEQTKKQILQSFGESEDINNFLNLDFQTYLPDVVLRKVDITSMANSLEVRVPFLDQRLVGIAQGLRGDLKLGRYGTKTIFKEAIGEFLPKSVIHQQKKGFGIPLSKVFSGNIKNYLKDTITKNSKLGNYFDIKELHTFIGASDNANSGNRLWAILMLNEWLEQQ